MTLVTRISSLPSFKRHLKKLKTLGHTSNSTNEIGVLRRQLKSQPEGGTRGAVSTEAAHI